ncbi:MAG: hypothetical protein KJ634_00545 [Gammaproteobacteria bacterium]|nr:hypothetical protein [Gammaproteobacteria bacterium]MBU1414088.1 hypothetical protein [Gammaproteobacteria bacterium]
MNLQSNFQRHPAAFLVLLAILFGLGGCASPTTVADLTPASMPKDAEIQPMQGSIEVRTAVPSETTRPTYVVMPLQKWIDSDKLKQAIEQSVRQFSAFGEVKQSNADYVLEVWLDKVQNALDIPGGVFIFDFTSVWRLTRVQDGKVLACEFVKGHGEGSGLASKAYPPGIKAATHEIIQKGLAAITDQSQSHLSALSTAGNRASIQPAN